MRRRSEKERRAMFRAIAGRGRRVGRPRKGKLPPTPRGEALLKRHEGLVRSVANRFARQFPTAELDDLLQEGRIGLLRARKLYKKAKGFAFSTFAVPHITTRVRRAAQGSHVLRVPEKPLRERLRKGTSTVRLRGKRGKEALERVASEGGIARAHASASLSRLLKKLPKAEQELLRLRYLNGGVTMRSAAKKLRKSLATVHGMERRAFARMRRASMRKT